jgi:hypothetical protein
MKNLIIRLWKPDVKTGCCSVYEERLIWEPGEFEKRRRFDNRTGSHQSIFYILENQSGSQKIMRESESSGSHKKWDPPNTGLDHFRSKAMSLL